ncbi:ECF sigma factor [Stieleria neptunia]|uniref:ECF sigma factor n=1 Tax=Stieleria neptunia TaxID=2527979 RepID=A0A518HSR5_9BACT|nr:ECF-type sigma factor [Stieleria neptunia]QDV43887.1 ECF sigma factor [Stieleria neptunia]
MENPGSISIWIEHLPSESEEAQEVLFKRYRSQLTAYAAARLRALGVRSKDADDITQEVFHGFFRRISQGKMPDLENRNDLWLKLTRICGDRVKEARRKKFTPTESVFGQFDAQDGRSPLEIPADYGHQLDSCLHAVEHALLKNLLAQEHPDLPEIVALRINGMTIEEVAKRMDRSKATIERRLRSVDRIIANYRSIS